MTIRLVSRKRISHILKILIIATLFGYMIDLKGKIDYTKLSFVLSNSRNELSMTDEYGSNYTSKDLIDFKALMERWPHENKPKAAIYFLVKSDPVRLEFLKLILKQVQDYFTEKYKYPIIIFHEENLENSMKNQLRNIVHRTHIYFQEIVFSVPSNVKKLQPQKTLCPRHEIGYGHMSRFHSKLVYEHPIIISTGLQYVWRLDDDSLLQKPLKFDPFKYMQDMDKLYGWHDIRLEKSKCIKYLYSNVTEFLQTYGLPEVEGWNDDTIYYNNFEISSLKVWKSKNYENYINFLDKTGGIYSYRWGDAPIKSIYIKLFLNPKNIHHFKSISYYHKSIHGQIKQKVQES